MKRLRIKSSLLCLLALLLASLSLCACGQQEPELEYTPEAERDARVYIDVLSFKPCYAVYVTTDGRISLDRNYTHLICYCCTPEQTGVWICVKMTEYRYWVDSSYSSYTSALNKPSARTAVFSAPRRIHGKVQAADALVDALSEEIGDSLIFLTSLDPEKTQEEKTEQPFSAETTHGDKVSLEIVSIMPFMGESDSTLGIYYDRLFCHCTLADGSTVDLMLKRSDYQKTFDPEAKISPYGGLFETLELPEGRRVHGTAYFSEAFSHKEGRAPGEMTVVYESAD